MKDGANDAWLMILLGFLVCLVIDVWRLCRGWIG